MARRTRDDEEVEERKFPIYSFGNLKAKGNLLSDPYPLNDDGDFVIVRVACNSQDFREEGDMVTVNATLSGNYATWALAELSKGDRVVVDGPVFFKVDYYTPKDSDEEQVQPILSLRGPGHDSVTIARDHRFFNIDDDSDRGPTSKQIQTFEERLEDREAQRSKGSKNSRRSSGRSEESRKDDDEADTRPRSTRRSSRSGAVNDDEDEDISPNTRSSRRSSSRETEDEPPVRTRTRRSSGTRRNVGDDVDE